MHPEELNEESKEPRKRTQKFDDKMLNKECRLTRKEAAMRLERDKVYFEGYSEVGIHEEMIMDTVRTEAYREAIEKLVKDQVVADIGAGSGILSIFAAVSGAKKVFAIEKADIVSTCRQNIKERNLEQCVQVIHSLAEEAHLPVEKVDVIVSEWIGYFLLFERMLPSVLLVRDKYLRNGGVMIPQRARIHIAGVCEDSKNYGISLRGQGLPKFVEPKIIQIRKERIITSTATLQDLDLRTLPSDFDSFRADVELIVERDEMLAGIVGWFELEMSPGVWLSTAPDQEPTHWQQTFFPIEYGYHVKSQMTLRIVFIYQPSQDDHRGMRVDLFVYLPGTDQQLRQRYEMR